MEKYLWDLNLEEIPLGWQKTYDNAVKNFPDGMIDTLPDFVDDGENLHIQVKQHYSDPVKYRDRILEVFNNEKIKALHLLENEKSIRILFNSLLKIDVKLYILLELWLRSDDYISEYGPDIFTPSDLDNQMGWSEYNIEFDSDILPEHIREYFHLKFLNDFSANYGI